MTVHYSAPSAFAFPRSPQRSKTDLELNQQRMKRLTLLKLGVSENEVRAQCPGIDEGM